MRKKLGEIVLDAKLSATKKVIWCLSMCTSPATEEHRSFPLALPSMASRLARKRAKSKVGMRTPLGALMLNQRVRKGHIRSMPTLPWLLFGAERSA